MTGEPHQGQARFITGLQGHVQQDCRDREKGTNRESERREEEEEKEEENEKEKEEDAMRGEKRSERRANKGGQMWKTDRTGRSVPGQLAGLSGCLLYGRAFLLVALSCLSVQARPCRALLTRSRSLLFSRALAPAPTPTCRASNSIPDRSILLLLRAVYSVLNLAPSLSLQPLSQCHLVSPFTPAVPLARFTLGEIEARMCVCMRACARKRNEVKLRDDINV